MNLSNLTIDLSRCHKSLSRHIFLLILYITIQAYSQDLDTSFDWNCYTTWKNQTVYSRSYVVNQRHPDASDNNPGTFEKPFLTINKAASVLEAGERVIIYSGVYRELIEPLNDGDNPDKMISYEAAPGEVVIIKGSTIFDEKWIQKRVMTDIIPDSSLTYTWSRKVWLATLPDELFANGYYPFKLPNILPEEYALMPWAQLVKNLSPYHSSRGLLWQNGKRMIQLEDYGDVQKVEGSFWVDADGKTVHIHPFGGVNPNGDLFEIGTRDHLLWPKKIGMGYIQLRGLAFEHCANGFLRTSTGAVNTRGGHHWIIEGNSIREINSSGLEFGYNAYERLDPAPENIQPRKDQNLGGMIIRNNNISECGTAGIRSFVVHDAIIEGNHIWNCGWQDAENYWECSGIKILLSRYTLVKGNHIHHIQGGNGIWLDWDNKYSRVTANIIHDVQNIQGGIFVEASQTPNLVDNNLIWNVDGNGIYANDTDYLMIYHNLVANTTGPVVHAIVATKRKLHNRWLTATKNKVKNNLFINGGAPINFDPKLNEADYNLYVTSKEPININLEEWQKSGQDLHSEAIKAFVKFSEDAKYFIWEPQSSVPNTPYLKESGTDFFGNNRDVTANYPGPFNNISKAVRVFLAENRHE